VRFAFNTSLREPGPKVAATPINSMTVGNRSKSTNKTVTHMWETGKFIKRGADKIPFEERNAKEVTIRELSMKTTTGLSYPVQCYDTYQVTVKNPNYRDWRDKFITVDRIKKAGTE